MSEVRGLLERAGSRFPAPDRVMDRLAERRDRKRRNRRIVSAVVAIALAALALGGLLDTFRSANERRPASNRSAITPENVGDLSKAWVGITPHTPGSDQGISNPPVVDGDRVYVDTQGFFLDAFGTSCGSGGSSCEPLWVGGGTGSTQGIAGRVVWPPAAADGHVYLATTNDALSAFPAVCGSNIADCGALWFGKIRGIPSNPVVSGDLVYVFAGGTVYAFPTSCTSYRCPPTWTGGTPEKGSLSDPAHLTVADGMVYVAVGGSLYAFPTACADAGCDPVWSARRIAGSTEGGTISLPVVSEGVVFVSVTAGSRSELAAFPVSCRGSCDPLWTWMGDGNGMSIPVAAAGAVYATQGSAAGSSLMAFPAMCRTDGAACAPTWVADGRGAPAVSSGRVFVSGGDRLLAYGVQCGADGSTCEPDGAFQEVSGEPVVAGDVVFAAGSGGRDLRAFDARCTDAACSPVWTGTTGGRVSSEPIVADDAVYVGTGNGMVVAFELRKSAAGGPPPAALVAGAIVLVLAVVGISVRRRHQL